MENLVPVLIAIGALAVIVLGVLVLVARFYRQVLQGQALIVNTMKEEPVVTFTGAVVLPIIHRSEVMDISVKTVELDRRGKEGLICQDNIRADINVTFFVRVNKTRDDVLKVAQSIGCVRASDSATLRELFSAKFAEGLKTVGKHFDFEDLYTKRDDFKDKIIGVIGTDLNGFVLDDCAIDYLEQTPLEALDKDNIMDADGIRKITELTTAQNTRTNELQQKQRMEIGNQNLTADEAVFRFDQRRAEADAKKNREIAVAQAREMNEAARIANEEKKKTEVLVQKNEEEVKVTLQAKERGVAVAEKQKQREIVIEEQRVEKARDLEANARDREVTLARISKDKEVEVQRKEIADIIRGRIALEKTVAAEEENIKNLRVEQQAQREWLVLTKKADGEAEEAKIRMVKAASAGEDSAKHRAREKIVVAEADLESADKVARAKIRVAEGVTAEQAAKGLADARVKEADAAASEKQGLVDARISFEKLQAAANGEERQGLARARVQEAQADALQKQGLAQAAVVRETGLAEAAATEQKGLATVRVKEADADAVQKQGMAQATIVRETGAAAASAEEQKGLAGVRVKEADATAIEKVGQAEALAVREKLLAEAKGLSEKAGAMKALDPASRAHEEFRLQLEKERTVSLESVRMRRDVAEAQAKVLAEALGHAKINIVGGDGAFFDRFVRAVGSSQTIDATIEQSDTLQTVLKGYLSGEKSLPQDLKDVLTRPALGTDDLQRLSLSGVLLKLMAGADDEALKGKLEKLHQRAKELGIDALVAR
jgi:uncharacterized membrane protein YqiK